MEVGGIIKQKTIKLKTLSTVDSETANKTRFRRFDPRRCKPEWGRGLGMYHSIQPVAMNFRLTFIHWVAAAEQLCRGDYPRHGLLYTSC